MNDDRQATVFLPEDNGTPEPPAHVSAPDPGNGVMLPPPVAASARPQYATPARRPSRTRTWLLVGGGVVVLAVAAYFGVQALTGDGAAPQGTSQAVASGGVQALPPVPSDWAQRTGIDGQFQVYYDPAWEVLADDATLQSWLADDQDATGTEWRWLGAWTWDGAGDSLLAVDAVFHAPLEGQTDARSVVAQTEQADRQMVEDGLVTSVEIEASFPVITANGLPGYQADTALQMSSTPFYSCMVVLEIPEGFLEVRATSLTSTQACSTIAGQVANGISR